jgi:serine/threonine protein kinase
MSGRVVLGRYRIVTPLARGGMGIIYLGRLEGAAGFSKPVVIKTVIPDAKDTRAAQLFVREAKILSNLEHPSIVGVLDFGQVDGEYIMVLEYVHGFHLGFWARYVREARGNMPVTQAVEVMLPVLDALEFAHRLTRADGTPLDIVHRDVSPANILIDQSGHVKLHDFGIARMADDEFKTQDGTFRGTLSFTAPETLQGIAASARSDLYACGVILYQLLTGSNPFRGEQPSETLHRVVTHVPPRLTTLRDDVSEAIDAAVAKAMEKEPANRFDSAASFAAALRAARTWSEDEAAAELGRVIHDDFASAEMPALLSLETLQSRDAAWRAALPARSQAPLRSSRPPGRSGQETETASIPFEVEAPTVHGLPSAELLVLARSAGALPSAESVTELAQPSTIPAPAKRRPGLVLGLVALAVAGAGAAYPLLRKNADPPPPRFLLIEKQADGDAEAKPAQSSAPATVPATAAEPPGAPTTSGSTAVKATHGLDVSKPSSSGATLTSAFQKQRGRVEACFRQNPSEATPTLNLHFQVEASGAVRAADLSPSAVAGSALGSCILSVARSTHFPAGDAAVSFTIPITARKTGG